MAEEAYLTSWNEIATYMGKSVRTVQRWERELGLPVRRGIEQYSVVAVRSELDAWLSRLPLSHPNPPGGVGGVSTEHRQDISKLSEQRTRLGQLTRRLAQDIVELGKLRDELQKKLTPGKR